VGDEWPIDDLFDENYLHLVRMFSYTELRSWLLEAGFREVAGFAGDGSGLTATSRRMILVAER
jgi:hypothetical protein